MDLPSLRRETRYGMPAADQVLFNRHYVIGYSYYFRQAKWALEIVDADIDAEREDPFRPDYRVPINFRPDLKDYAGSGYDRGHLVACANQMGSEVQASETFLLSNMAPQTPGFNRGVWKQLESAVRELNKKPRVLETYVICGPVFYFDRAVDAIGVNDRNKVSIPVPHAFFKSILAETNRGSLHMWSFVIPNDDTDDDYAAFQQPTEKVERLAGIKLWERLVGSKTDSEKRRRRKLW